MTRNQYEHYMISVEHNKVGEQESMDMTAVAVDLSPESPVTMRHLESSEVQDDMDAYVTQARASMNQVCDRMIEQVMAASADGPVAYHGYVDLVDQLQMAPNLLLANMLGALLSSCAEEVLKEQSQKEAVEGAFEQSASN